MLLIRNIESLDRLQLYYFHHRRAAGSSKSSKHYVANTKSAMIPFANGTSASFVTAIEMEIERESLDGQPLQIEVW
jgi:hypothetical protein